MFTVVLYQPEIPPNTGNIIRLCANTGADLHLVKPLGFPLYSAKMRRAGLDYHEFAKVVVHENFADCLNALAGRRIFALTTKGSSRYDKADFQAGDVFLFGPETRGLPAEILESSNIRAAAALAANGYGVGFLSGELLEHLELNIPFGAYPLQNCTLHIESVAAWRTGDYLPRYAQAFIKLMEQV